MAEPAYDVVTDKAVAEILELFQEDQSADFIALELIVSSRVLDAVRPGTKLALAIEHASSEFPRSGFWQAAPMPLRKIVELTEHALRRAETTQERRKIIETLLEGNPTFLSSLEIPDTDTDRKV